MTAIAATGFGTFAATTSGEELIKLFINAGKALAVRVKELAIEAPLAVATHIVTEKPVEAAVVSALKVAGITLSNFMMSPALLAAAFVAEEAMKQVIKWGIKEYAALRRQARRAKRIMKLEAQSHSKEATAAVMAAWFATTAPAPLTASELQTVVAPDAVTESNTNLTKTIPAAVAIKAPEVAHFKSQAATLTAQDFCPTQPHRVVSVAYKHSIKL